MKKDLGKHGLVFLWVMVILTIAFFATRIFNLTSIPIFTDEAIYLRWAQIGSWDARWRFISLTDGKQPLLIWLFIVIFKLIKGDPLILGRMVSIVCGFSAMVGIAVFSWYKTRSWKGVLVGGLLYVLVPFFLFYDRLAIYEALFNTIYVWTLFMLYLFAKKLRLDTAILLGTLVGFGLLTKSYANFFLYLLPTSLLLVEWPKTNKKAVFLKWVCLSLVVFVQAQIYNNIQRLSEFGHIIGQKNLQFVYSVQEFLKQPLQSFYGNASGLTSWLVGYVTFPLLFVILVSVMWKIKSEKREGLFFAIWFIVPFLALAFFGKVIYPRFLLFMLLPLLIPTAEFITHVYSEKKRRLWVYMGSIILLMPLLYFNFQIITNPLKAPLPPADKEAFMNDWPAGYGIKEVVHYLTEESKKGPLVIGTEGTFGLFPHALELYLGENVNITTKAFWPLSEFPEELRVSAQTKPTFLVFKERQNIPPDWPIILIAQYQRGDGDSYLRFFRVTP